MALTAFELLKAQGDATSLCDLMIQVQHVIVAKGGLFEAQQSFAPATTVPCMIEAPSDEALQVYGPKIGEHFAWQVLVPVGSDVRIGDQVTMPNGIVGTVIGPDLVKSYALLNEFLVVAVR